MLISWLSHRCSNSDFLKHGLWESEDDYGSLDYNNDLKIQETILSLCFL